MFVFCLFELCWVEFGVVVLVYPYPDVPVYVRLCLIILGCAQLC